MNETLYRTMNDKIHPEEALIQEVLHHAKRRRPGARRLLTAAAAIVLCICLAVPAAAQTDLGYSLLYLLSPSAAQFFQPVQRTATDNGVTMEVVAVRVEGDTAQAYITLTGENVDETCDLFDSYSFHLPFDQIGHCERVGWDEATQTVTFLCTVQTMDGSPIPEGGKMTFSVGCFLSGKTTAEDLQVELNLSDYATRASIADGYSCSGGGGMGALSQEDPPMLLPGEALAVPVPGISVTAAGYVNGLFHVQVNLGNIHRTDNHCSLYLRAEDGTKVQHLAGFYFRSDSQAPEDDTYEDFVFDIAPEELEQYTLYGNFCTASNLTEGFWRVTFPLENTEPLQ